MTIKPQEAANKPLLAHVVGHSTERDASAMLSLLWFDLSSGVEHPSCAISLRTVLKALVQFRLRYSFPFPAYLCLCEKEPEPKERRYRTYASRMMTGRKHHHCCQASCWSSRGQEAGPLSSLALGV